MAKPKQTLKIVTSDNPLYFAVYAVRLNLAAELLRDIEGVGSVLYIGDKLSVEVNPLYDRQDVINEFRAAYELNEEAEAVVRESEESDGQ